MSFFRHFLQILLDTFEIWTLKKPFLQGFSSGDWGNYLKKNSLNDCFFNYKVMT